MTAGTGSDIGSSGWTAGIGSPGIRSFGLDSGHRVIWQGSGLRVNWYWIVWLDSGHWVTRHQVIWLDSGHRVIWQGSGLRVNRHDSEHRVIRYRIVWLDSGHRVTRYDSGHWVTRHQVIWLDSGHRIRYRIIWINSGHRVNWPNRIVRLDQFIMLGRGIRLNAG
ncbi:unnamed protein product, partial [Staurois parvus]